jgi:hypothetical protein
MERKTTMVLRIVLLKIKTHFAWVKLPILPGLNCPFYLGFIKKPARAVFFIFFFFIKNPKGIILITNRVDKLSDQLKVILK